MNHSLLAIESLWLAAGFGLLSFLVVILVEAGIMTGFKLNGFGRNVRDSLMANIGSALLCLLLFLIMNKIEIEELTHLIIFTVFFLVSAFFEGWIIKLLNRSQRWSRILAASLVMNLVTYAGSYYGLMSGHVLG
jgi:hypothetical protein